MKKLEEIGVYKEYYIREKDGKWYCSNDYEMSILYDSKEELYHHIDKGTLEYHINTLEFDKGPRALCLTGDVTNEEYEKLWAGEEVEGVYISE